MRYAFLVSPGNALRVGSSSAIQPTAAAAYLGTTGNVVILHTTIGGVVTATASALYIGPATVGITDTIIANHATGIDNTGGTVYENYNLFYANNTDKSGSTSGGGNDHVGPAFFVNPAADNYHLGVGSLAVDTGVNVGITRDIDGDSRPFDAAPDIGFDEYTGVTLRLYLPAVMR